LKNPVDPHSLLFNVTASSELPLRYHSIHVGIGFIKSGHPLAVALMNNSGSEAAGFANLLVLKSTPLEIFGNHIARTMPSESTG